MSLGQGHDSAHLNAWVATAMLTTPRIVRVSHAVRTFRVGPIATVMLAQTMQLSTGARLTVAMDLVGTLRVGGHLVTMPQEDTPAQLLAVFVVEVLQSCHRSQVKAAQEESIWTAIVMVFQTA